MILYDLVQEKIQSLSSKSVGWGEGGGGMSSLEYATVKNTKHFGDLCTAWCAVRLSDIDAISELYIYCVIAT